MSRKRRVDHPNAWHHVTSRIMADLDAFTRNEHLFIQKVLAEAVAVHEIRLHAYCIMPNHFHLVVESVKPVLSAFMKVVKQRIAQFINRSRIRRGPVFQQRFHNVLIEKDAHWHHLIAYVHLNPVPSVTVRPADYQWSSHRAYAGIDEAPEWLTTETMLDAFDSRTELLAYVEGVRSMRLAAREEHRHEEQPPSDATGQLPDRVEGVDPEP
jgi:REP element-mobilizing transposase RayT